MNLAQALDATPVVASTGDRNFRFPSPTTNQRVFNLGTGNTERWNGSAWVVDLAGAASPLVSVSPVFNVRAPAFGAVADGVTDDRPAFAAVAAAIAAVGGGVAYIPEGTYAVGGNTVLWPSNTIVRGAGRDKTTIKRIGLTNATPANLGAAFGTGSADGVFYVAGAHGQNVVFEDLTIDGNYLANAALTSTIPHADGIRADFTDGVVVRRVHVKDTMNSGVYFFGCRRTRCLEVLAETCGRIAAASSRNGISITGPIDDATDQGAQDKHWVVGCEAYQNTDEGLAFGRVGLVIISGCVFDGNGDKGIEGDVGSATADVTSVPAGVIIIGCYVLNSGNVAIGVNNSNVQRVVVADCVVENCGQAALTTDFTSGSLLVVTGNIFRNFNTLAGVNHGVTVGDFDQVVVVGNLLADGGGGGGSGIAFLAALNPRQITVTGNIVKNINGSGIAVNGQATGTVTGNYVTGAGTRGIEITSNTGAINELLVANNYTVGGGGAGLLIRSSGASPCSNVRVKGHVANGNAGQGLLCSQAAGAVTGLRFEDCDFSGNTLSSVSGLTAAMVSGFRIHGGYVPLVDAAGIAVDAALGETFAVTLGGNRTVNAPTNPVLNQRILFVVTQDGTGGRTLGWNAVFKTAWSDAGNVAGKSSTIAYRYDGTNWRQESAQGPYV